MKGIIFDKIRTARLIRDMLQVFVRKHVARSAAALSYYLTLTVFPFLICMSAILGSMHVKQAGALGFLADIVSEDIFDAITGFFDYISNYSTELMLSVGLVALVTTSSAAFRMFNGIMGEIQGEKRFRGIWGGVFSFVFSIALLVAIYVSALVILSGEWLLTFLETYVNLGNILEFWAWMRFIVLFLLLFGIIYGAYNITSPKETKRTHRLPGAFAASVILVAASMIYSRMINASIKYALLYGTLASFVILMVWLYTCGIILIMGNVFNISLHKLRNEKVEE